jgi:hypothetical protein
MDMGDVDNLSMPLGGGRERETSGLDSHPPSPADPISIATLHDEVSHNDHRAQV